MKHYGDLAIIAGGSQGIGLAFAHYLANEGYNLLLIARNQDKLDKVQHDLQEQYKTAIQTLSCDLAATTASEQIMHAIGTGRVGIMVYNAGLSYIGKFEKNTVEHHRQIMQTNVLTMTQLVQAVGIKMLAQKQGAIIIMSSMAGFQGTGYIAAYAASKAYNKILAESLYYEWKDRGVDVIGCCAGATATANYINTEPASPGFIKPTVQQPHQVVQECFQKLSKTPSFICGFGNKLASFFMLRVLPRWLAVKIMGDTTQKMYRRQINQ